MCQDNLIDKSGGLEMCRDVDAMNVNDKMWRVSHLSSAKRLRKNCLCHYFFQMIVALHAISGLESLLNFKSLLSPFVLTFGSGVAIFFPRTDDSSLPHSDK